MKNDDNKLTRIGIYILFIAITISSLYLLNRSRKPTQNPIINVGSSAGPGSSERVGEQAIYKRELFSYQIRYPSTLKVWEIGSGGGYIDFVRFEESAGSEFKGFAIGVSELGFDTEIDRIKKIFESQGALLAEETTLNYQKQKARQLFFKPQSIVDGEERVVVIFSNGEYTYSISTVPWQVEEVVSRFEFLN